MLWRMEDQMMCVSVVAIALAGVLALAAGQSLMAIPSNPLLWLLLTVLGQENAAVCALCGAALTVGMTSAALPAWGCHALPLPVTT